MGSNAQSNRHRASLDPFQPVAAFKEAERGPDGRTVDSATVLIANRECPFQCIYCDLWKHTLDEPTPIGAVPTQIDVALQQLGHPTCEQIKLYNAGNWFDGKAIPPGDHRAIADRLQSFDRVIIENHPKLCDERVVAFRELIPGQLEIAVGVETVDESIMQQLDKAMTVDDTERAIVFLRERQIDVRCFVLFPPPFQTEDIVEPALEAIDWCFARDATVVVLIPLRTDSGTMPELVAQGMARPPQLEELEAAVTEFSTRRDKSVDDKPLASPPRSEQRLFVDLWDAESHFGAADNARARIERLRLFNATQEW